MKIYPIPRKRSGLKAFSLVEVMMVLVIMGFIVAALGGSFSNLASRQYPKDAARQFQEMVREASRLARREQTPVRITFILPETASALKKAGVKDEGEKPVPGCRLLVFRVPTKDLPLVTLCPTGSEEEENVPVSRTPRFPSLLGEWTAPAGRHPWVRWHKTVAITGDLADSFKNRGFETTAEDFQYQPAFTWAEKRDSAKKLDPYSVYPEHYARSPYQILRVVRTGSVPATETVEIQGLGSVKAEDLWKDQKIPHWEQLEGTPSSSGIDRVELPSIDFLPDGGLANREKEELVFRFGSLESEKEKWVVKLRTRDAETWIE